MTQFHPHGTASGTEPTLDQLISSNRLDELLDQWTPVAHKLLPAGATLAQLPDYTYALLEGLATAAAMSDRERAVFLNAYRVWMSGQRETLQTLIDRLPPDSAERQRLGWLLSLKASDRRRASCLAAALELPGDDRSGSPLAHVTLPPFALFGLQLWADGFSYGQFMEYLTAHRQRHAPEADQAAESAPPAGSQPNLVHDFYRWVLERDGCWRRGDYAVVLEPDGAAMQFKSRSIQHYADPLQALAECAQKVWEAGQAGHYEEAEVADWLASLKMPEPEHVAWEGSSAAGLEPIGPWAASRLALIQYGGRHYALVRNRSANTLALCPLEVEQVGPPLATSEAHQEINWWIRRGETGRKAIVAWMLKKAELKP